MRLEVLLVLLAGCRQLLGFEEPAIATAQTDAGADAAVTVDAPPDAAPVWTVVETMMIDTANSSPVVSVTVLALGRQYRLRASGIASTVVDLFEGDADYYDFANPKDNACCEDIGLGVDDPMVDEDTTPDWGPYSPTHVYEIDFPATGNTISAVYQDTFYGNNNGTLTLEILELQ